MDFSATAETIRALTEPYQKVPGGLLPALWNIQNSLGYIPDQHVAVIADSLNLSLAEVHGVISFYHDFRASPVVHSVKICRAEACQAMGARQLANTAKNVLGSDFDQRSTPVPAQAQVASKTNNDVELRSVYCLGLCANAPAAMINGELHAGLNDAKLTELLSTLAAENGQATT